MINAGEGDPTSATAATGTTAWNSRVGRVTEGFETLASADEGMERINGCPPDCVVSDYNP